MNRKGPLSEAIEKGIRGRYDFWERRINEEGIFGSVYLNTPGERIYKFTEGHKELISRMVKDKDVLEIGCGYGRVLTHFRECKSYIGIDFMPNYIDEAKLRLEALQKYDPGTYNKFSVEMFDARELKEDTFPHKFDIVVGITVISSLEDAFYELVSKLEKVIRPNSYFVWLEEAWFRIDYVDHNWNLDWI